MKATRATQKKKPERKVTVMLPRALIDSATKVSGEGLTPTLRKGLELVAAQNVYKQALALRGTLKSAGLDWKKLRDEAE